MSQKDVCFFVCFLLEKYCTFFWGGDGLLEEEIHLISPQHWMHTETYVGVIKAPVLKHHVGGHIQSEGDTMQSGSPVC